MYSKIKSLEKELRSSCSGITMFIHKVFPIITNLFGLNFYELKVSLTLILFLNIVVINLHGVINVYYANLISNPKGSPVYVIIDFVQLGWPLVYKNILFVWSIKKKSFDIKFEEKVRKTYGLSLIRKNQKKFLILVASQILILLTKFIFQQHSDNYIYNSSSFLTTVINATSDFVFVYHMLCLRDHVRFIRNSYRNLDVGMETLNIIEIKRIIYLRYSMTLAFAISHDFLLFTFSLYWIFVRIIFGALQTMRGTKGS